MALLLPVGFLTDWLGRRPWVVVGMTLMAAGAVAGWLATDAEDICWMGLCYGVGMGFYSPSFQGMMYDAIPRARMGQAIVALMLVRYLAVTATVAVCGGLIDWFSAGAAVKEYRVAFLLSFAFAVLAAVLACLAPRSGPREALAVGADGSPVEGS
jgi:MFS family permease